MLFLRSLLVVGATILLLCSAGAAEISLARNYSELLAKPHLSRAEKAALVDQALTAYIASLSVKDARDIATSNADPSSRALVAWVRSDSEAGDFSPEERLFYLGQLFNRAKTIDPVAANLLFGRAASLFPVDYARVSLFSAMVKSGWEVSAPEFDVCVRQHLALRPDER